MTSAASASPDPHVLREYALIADGERGAIIGPRGDLCWLCVPRWDSPSVFTSLIGGGGSYAITPADRFVWGGYYEDRSLIWRNRWVTSGGIVECRDALLFPPEEHRTVVLRRVLARDCDTRIAVRLDPRADYGSAELTDLTRQDGIWTGRTGSLSFRWTGGAAAHPVRRKDEDGLALELVVAKGDLHDFVLEIAEGSLPGDPVDPEPAWRATEAAWHEAVPVVSGCLAGPDVAHSLAVLRGLTSRGGGMVAAATSSLPERAEASRNYDYRYVWIRDQCFAGEAVAALGSYPLLDDAVRFVRGALLEHGPDLRPAYTTTGDRVPDQRSLDLPGYPGGYDLVGNWVNKQFQLDNFGEALLLLSAAARADRLDTEGWSAIEVAADAIAARWTEPDAGIWEIDPKPWTHSRLICAAGLRAAAGVAPAGPRSAQWLALADRIVADTAAHALHPTGRWQRAPDDAGLDGALLLPGLRGAVPADDPRTRATLDGYLDALTDNGYAYRFRHDERPLADAEGSFLLCGFLVALALQQRGDAVEARAWFERNRAACGPPMLYSEEFDVVQHQMRGNLPQAFVHAVMIEAAAKLTHANPET
jgi:hypothetical protein